MLLIRLQESVGRPRYNQADCHDRKEHQSFCSSNLFRLLLGKVVHCRR